MERALQDLRYAARLLWKDRGFSLTTAATLALCLAANIAIFAVVNAVLLRPLPFPEPARILMVSNAYPGAGVVVASNGVPDYYDRLRDVTVFEELAMYRTQGVTLGGQGDGEPERVTSMPVTPSFFRLLRTEPFRGRLFTEAEAEPGQERPVVLSYGFWQRKFAGRDGAIGQPLRINGVPYTIVGVAPRGFRFVNPEVQLWTAVAFSAAERADDRRHSNSWQQIGRLKGGASLEQAQQQLDAVNAANMVRFPQFREILTNAGFHTRAVVLQDELVRESRRTLYLLWGGVTFVLIIGCVNVANLASIRATARVRELATRAALGATLSRLARQLMTESVLLSVIGGVAGLVLGWWALSASAMMGFDQLPRGEEIALDARTVTFALALVLAVGLSVGLLPVLALRRTNLAQVVREEGRSGTASRGARVARRVLVTSQVAFALILLVGAGVLLASFQRVLAVDPGFDPGHLLTGSISLPASRYAAMPEVRMTMQRLIERVRAVPGVEHVGATTMLPFTGSSNDSVILAEGYQMAPGESLVSPNTITASDDYFAAMKIRLLEGRFFDGRDVEGGMRAIIVDERLARKFWRGQSALGKRMYFPGRADNLMAPPPESEWFTVVGVVSGVRNTGLVETGEGQRVGAYYFPYAQQPARGVSLAIRSTQAPDSVISGVRAAIAEVDPELPFYDVRAMTERVDESLIDRRTPMLLAVGFATVALFLAAIGIYGVLAYQVTQRTREIGIRLALGAATSTIFAMILREGAIIVLSGAVLGLAGAFFLRQTLQSQLYEIGAMDPRVTASVAGVLLAVALTACLLPARRAARTDAVNALMGSN
jgi:predicted permease